MMKACWKKTGPAAVLLTLLLGIVLFGCKGPNETVQPTDGADTGGVLGSAGRACRLSALL